ncbi:MAG: efflux RND transporter permease subunit [bacterium]
MSLKFFDWVLKHPLMVIFLTILTIAAAGSGGRLLSMSNDYRMFFSEENPQLLAFEALQNTYTKTDNVLFVLSPKDGKVFTPQSLETVKWLTKESWQIPYSSRVDSITNFQHTEAEEDDLLVRDLIEDPTADDLEKAQRVAVNEPLLRKRLISTDAAHTGVNVTIQLPGKQLNEVPEVAAFARDLVEQVKQRDHNMDVHLTGMVIMNNAFPEASQGDMQTLYPGMLLIILIMLVFMLRSIPGTATTAIILIMSIAATMGLTGWIGITLSPPAISAPVMVMTLAVADCVHVLVNFLHGVREGKDKRAAMGESLRINLSPIFLTSLTTIIGFLSLNFSEAPPFRDLGNMAAMGVAVAFLLSITFLPAMMMLLPVKATRGDSVGSRNMKRLGDFVVKRRKLLFWGMALFMVITIAQVPRNVLNDEFVNYFDETISFRTDTDYAVENLTGIYLIQYSIPAKEEGGISDPEYLQNLEKFTQWYREQDRVIHVNTLSDTMKRLNRNMHGDDDDWYKLPDDRELAAQYLLLYEFSLPFGLDLNDQINVKKSATRLTVTLENVSSEELLETERRAQQWMQDNLPEYMWADGASPSVMFANIGHRNIRAMLKGTTVALVLISAILIFALRSFKVGMISLVPNLAPIGVAFGLWGMTVGQIGLALSVVSGMVIGIVVDDTVHFLSKYLRARREQGLGTHDAVRYAFSTVGTALWVTTIVLMFGFAVLATSHFELNAGMGLLTAIAIGIALVLDFLFLPPLLMKLDKQKQI